MITTSATNAVPAPVPLKLKLMKAMRDLIVLELGRSGSDSQRVYDVTDLYLDLAKAEVVFPTQLHITSVTGHPTAVQPNFNPYATAYSPAIDLNNPNHTQA